MADPQDPLKTPSQSMPDPIGVPQGPAPSRQRVYLPSASSAPVAAGDSEEADSQWVAEFDRLDQEAEIERLWDSTLLEPMRAEYGKPSLGEKAYYTFLSFGKAIGDAYAGLALEAVRNSPGAQNLKLFPGPDWLRGEAENPEQSRRLSVLDQSLLRWTNTLEPGMLDLVAGAVDSVAGKGTGAEFLGAPELGEDQVVGKAVDRLIAERSGNWSAYGHTAGVVTSFVTGPGAAIGRGSQMAVQPMLHAAERLAARHLAKGAVAGADAKLVGEALRSAKPLEALAHVPEWKKQAGTLKVVMGLGGRYMSDTLSMAAANVAQSYALTRPSERADAVWMAAVTAPLVAPIAKLGQTISDSVLAGRLSGQELKSVGNLYERMVRGQLTTKQADDILRSIPSIKLREKLANVIATGFEGTAMALIQPSTDMAPNVWDLWDKWLEGDEEAGSQLALTMFGSIIGTAMGKYGMQQELAPKFKHLRPDINTFANYLDADTIRRTRDRWSLARAVPSDSVGLGGDLPTVNPASGEMAGVGLPVYVVDPTREVVVRDDRSKPMSEGGYSESSEETPIDPTTGTKMSKVAGREIDPERIYEFRGQPVNDPFPQDSLPPEVVREIMHARARFAGLDGLIDPTLAAGWNPIIRFEEGAVGFSWAGQAADLRLVQTPQGPDVEVGPKLRAVLKDAGRPVPDLPMTPGIAASVMDSVTLLGHAMNMRGATTYERLGFREVVPGTWVDDESSTYYRMGLDGKSVVSDVWNRRIQTRDIVVQGGFGQPSFDGEAMSRWEGEGGPASNAPDGPPRDNAFQAFVQLASSRSVFSPDPVLDAIFSQAVTIAQHSDSIGGRELRRMFTMLNSSDFLRLMRPQTEEHLAHQIGAVATGHSNADVAVQELRAAIDTWEGEGGPAAPEPPDADPLPPTEPPPKPKPKPRTSAKRKRKPSAIDDAVQKAQQEPLPLPPKPPESPEDTARMMPKLARLEDLAQLHEDKGDPVAAAKLRSVIDNGDEALVDKMLAKYGVAELGSANFVGKEAASSMLKAGRRIANWLFTDRLEVLRGVADRPFVHKLKAAISRGEALKGRALDAFREAERGARKMRGSARAMVTVDDTPMPRWQALVEGRIQPATASERLVAKHGREAMLMLWDESVRIGVRRQVDEGKWKPLESRDNAVLPRIHGADWEAVMDSPQERAHLWDWLAAHNPELGWDAAKFETQFLERTAGGTQIDTANSQAAFEFVRQVKRFPAMLRGHELLETNPFEYFRKVSDREASRLSIIEAFGQGIPKDAREAIKAAEGIELQAGPEDALAAYQRELAGVPEGRQYVDMAKDVLLTAQGSVPYRRSAFFRALAPVESIIRSGQTMFSGIHDIPAPLVQGTAYAGWSRMARAFAGYAKSPREAVIAAERAGSIQRQMGSHDLFEADSKLAKVADSFGYLSSATERQKGAIFHAMAGEMLNDWGRGRVTGNDRDVVAELLNFSAQDQAALLSGKADEALRTRFQQEFVKLTTGRRNIKAASEFLASPNLQAIFRYTNWITGRSVEIGRNLRAIARPGATLPQRARAIGRTLHLGFGWAMTSPLTQLAAYMLADLFKGQDGMERWHRELSASPGAMVLKGLKGQVVGGPAAQLLTAADRMDARSWAGLTSVGDLAYQLADAWDNNRPSAPSGLAKRIVPLPGADMAADVASRILPTAIRDLGSLVGGAMVGEMPDARSDARMVNQFKSLNGLATTDFAKTKPAAFYEAMGEIRRAIRSGSDLSTDERVKMVTEKAAEAIRGALGLADEDSVASAIRSMQLVNKIPMELRGKLSEFADNPEQMQRIYEHDYAVRELARVVGKMHGERPIPLAQEIAQAEEQAALGARDVWRPLVARAQDAAALSAEAGEMSLAEIESVAASLAAFPDHLDGLFSDRVVRSIRRDDVGVGTRAHYLATIMRRRVLESLRDRRRERMIEDRDGTR